MLSTIYRAINHIVYMRIIILMENLIKLLLKAVHFGLTLVPIGNCFS